MYCINKFNLSIVIHLFQKPHSYPICKKNTFGFIGINQGLGTEAVMKLPAYKPSEWGWGLDVDKQLH